MEQMITAKSAIWAEVNAQGDLVIPRETAERFGLKPGARVRLEDDLNHVRLHRPVTQWPRSTSNRRFTATSIAAPAFGMCGAKNWAR